jgi:putative FmdB family regulatory protein
MPIYEFRCENGHTTERLSRYGQVYIICPVCGSAAARLAVPSSPPVVFGDTCVKVQNAIRDKARW